MTDDNPVPSSQNSRQSFGDILSKLKDVKVSIPESLPARPSPPSSEPSASPEPPVQNLPQESSIPSSPVESPPSASPVSVSSPPIPSEPVTPVEVHTPVTESPPIASPTPVENIPVPTIPAYQPSSPLLNTDRPLSTNMDDSAEDIQKVSTKVDDQTVESATRVDDTLNESKQSSQTKVDDHSVEMERLVHANAERTRRKMLRLNKIVDYVRTKGKITSKEVQLLLHVSRSGGDKYLTELVRKGLLKLEKKARLSFYHF